MENLDIDNMPPDELIQMMKEFLLYAQAYQLEDNLWNLAPEVCLSFAVLPMIAKLTYR